MLEDILKKMIRAAEEASLRLALAGGFAYSLYCKPRATADLDFVLFSDKDIDSAESILKGLFSSVYRNVESFSYPFVTVYRFLVIIKEEETVIDFLVPKSEDYCRELFSRIRMMHYDDIELPVISPEDLVILKRHSGREQDNIDAVQLETDLSGTLDTEYIEKWGEAE